MNKIQGAKCDDCPLKDRPFVPGCGSDKPQLVVIGEAPGYNEAKEGTPFVGASGKLLRQALAFHGLDDVYITNVVKCHPKGNKLPPRTSCRRVPCAAVLRQQTTS
jgi:uracil-DNA glycosylase family 4